MAQYSTCSEQGLQLFKYKVGNLKVLQAGEEKKTSTLQMGAGSSSETSASAYKTTRCHEKYPA